MDVELDDGAAGSAGLLAFATVYFGIGGNLWCGNHICMNTCKGRGSFGLCVKDVSMIVSSDCIILVYYYPQGIR